MRNLAILGTILTVAAMCMLAQQDPNAPIPAKVENKGMPPRATPGDYQAHAAVGPITLAAEFMQHSVPTPDGLLVNEDYVCVEAGLFGPPGARTTLNPLDFTLRINGKKNAIASEPYELTFKTLKDPEWEPPEPVGEKSKTSINGGAKGGLSGGGANPGDPPPVVHVPIKTQREWNQKVIKVAFPEGDRPLPQAGLLFFLYRSKASGIHSIELMYSGPAGKVTLPLNP